MVIILLITSGSLFAKVTVSSLPSPLFEREGSGVSLDSLRVRPQRTVPETYEDLDTVAVSLLRPDNLKQEAELDSLTGNYRVGTKLGSGGYLNTPILMTPDEYQQWTLRQSMGAYYRQKNREAFESSGKKKFDFTDMHFNLGPADKIFGPGGVSIKTQGSAEVKVGGNVKKQDNRWPPTAARSLASTSTRRST